MIIKHWIFILAFVLNSSLYAMTEEMTQGEMEKCWSNLMNKTEDYCLSENDQDVLKEVISLYRENNLEYRLQHMQEFHKGEVVLYFVESHISLCQLSDSKKNSDLKAVISNFENLWLANEAQCEKNAKKVLQQIEKDLNSRNIFSEFLQKLGPANLTKYRDIADGKKVKELRFQLVIEENNKSEMVMACLVPVPDLTVQNGIIYNIYCDQYGIHFLPLTVKQHYNLRTDK